MGQIYAFILSHIWKSSYLGTFSLGSWNDPGSLWEATKETGGHMLAIALPRSLMPALPPKRCCLQDSLKKKKKHRPPCELFCACINRKLFFGLGIIWWLMASRCFFRLGFLWDFQHGVEFQCSLISGRYLSFLHGSVELYSFRKMSVNLQVQSRWIWVVLSINQANWGCKTSQRMFPKPPQGFWCCWI